MAGRQALSQAEGVLLDWDGCVALGDRPLPAALRLIRAHADRVAIVSNNSTHLPHMFAALLADAGAPIASERVILAGDEALKRAARAGSRRALVLGDSRMRAHAQSLGLNLVREEADLVVLLRDTRFSYARLERAVNSLTRGARLIVANPDGAHPGPNGRVTPETGALLAAILACVDPDGIEMEVIGKPAPGLFESACAVLGTGPGRAVMVGDNPHTDIAGARALGLGAIWVGERADLSIEDLVER
ncbi:MAG: HAD-IIA family hydrolase [Phenylobacterium sp.]